jgi:hypothetical protein
MSINERKNRIQANQCHANSIGQEFAIFQNTN